MKQLAAVVFLVIPLLSGALPPNEITEYSLDGTECFNCNSKDFAQCATTPSSALPKVNCKDPKDQCITAIVNGITFRGCQKEVAAPPPAVTQVCAGSRCNYNIFPDDRLKCYQCAGKDCVEDFQGTLKPCLLVQNDDYCITDVIDANNVIRGCKSDVAYKSGQFVEMCKGSGCNYHPSTYSSDCLSCSEANSTSCVRLTPPPTGKGCRVPKEHTCEDELLLNRPIQCFVYKKSHNVIRGCTKNAGNLTLDKENFRACQGRLCNNDCVPITCVKCDSKTDAKCYHHADQLKPELCPSDMSCFAAQTSDGGVVRGCGKEVIKDSKYTDCYADGCNNKPYPLECHKCNSKNLADCATTPSASLPHAKCNDPNDQCVTAIVDGVTHRGCEKEINMKKDAISAKCDTNLCNSKIFPENRLQCYQCEGKNCPKDLKPTLKPCVNYVKDDSCVTDVKDETNVSRKCLSDPGYSAPKFAAVCKGAACNSHPPTYTSECLTCSQANVNDTCVRISTPIPAGQKCTLPKAHTCQETLLLNRPAECFTYKASGKVVRGCVKDAGKLALEKANFETCQGPLCNNQCLSIKCVKCDSRKEPKCDTHANELTPELCGGEMSCFAAQTPDGAIIRGCGKEFNKESRNIACDGDGCNTKAYALDCHKCDSSKLAECATNPSPSLPHGRCNDLQDQCITAIVNGTTHRGCEKELNVAKDAISAKCNSDLCNGKIFPEDRLKCFQCDGTNCVKDLQKTLKPCVNYVKGDSCVTDVKDQANITRKCLSDPGYKVPKYAEVCKVAGCNNHTATYISECTLCAQTDEWATSCVRTSLPAEANKTWTLPKEQTCKETLLLNRPSQCFTYRAPGKVARGCLKDAGKLVEDKENFQTCEGKLCNNQCIPITCVICDSKKQPKCATQADELKAELCPGDVHCFAAQSADGATIRGCGKQFSGVSQISTCSAEACNNKNTEVALRPSCSGNSCNITAAQTTPNITFNGDNNFVIINFNY